MTNLVTAPLTLSEIELAYNNSTSYDVIVDMKQYQDVVERAVEQAENQLDRVTEAANEAIHNPNIDITDLEDAYKYAVVAVAKQILIDDEETNFSNYFLPEIELQ